MIESNQMFHLLWTQFWQVTVLIGIVALLARVWGKNRPHLTVALWLIVLLKCLTPPVLHSPGGLLSWIRVPLPIEIDLDPTHVADRAAVDAQLLTALETSIVIGNKVHQQASPVPLNPRMSQSPYVASSHAVANSPERLLTFQRSAVVVWLAGVLLTMLISTSRIWYFFHRIKLGTCASDVEAERILERMRKRLRLKRPVTLLVSESPYGPAVFGLWRAVIVLPKSIVGGQPVRRLQPIIAHELIHLRRGDLWLGAVQLVVQAIWWFHPLVWLVNRWISREIERCCDEEVIAKAGVSASEYARSLLDVLQLKQHLEPVPSFPGVNPFQITSKRLERIMRIGQGCQKRTSVWCWICALVLAAVALPGAAAQVATHQDPTDSSPTVATPAQTDDELVEKTYEVAALHEKLRKEVGKSGLDRVGFERILARHAQCSFSATFPAPLDSKALAAALSKPQPSLRWLGDGTIAIIQTGAAHGRIEAALDQLNRVGLGQVRVNITLVECRAEVLDQLTLDWELGERDGRAELVRNYAYVNRDELSPLAEAISQATKTQVLCAPSLLLPYGVGGRINTLVPRPFIAGHDQGHPIMNWGLFGWEISVVVVPRDEALVVGYTVALNGLFNRVDRDGDEELTGRGFGKTEVQSTFLTRDDHLIVAKCQDAPPDGAPHLLAFIEVTKIDGSAEVEADGKLETLSDLLTRPLASQWPRETAKPSPDVSQRRVYYVGDLLPTTLKPENGITESDFDDLMTAIKAELDPVSWEGGDAMARLQPFPPTLSLVVTQTPENLRQIEYLFDEWRLQRSHQVVLETRLVQVPPQRCADVLPDGFVDNMQLSPEQVTALVQRSKSRSGVNLLQAPTVTMFNGQSYVMSPAWLNQPSESMSVAGSLSGNDEVEIEWALAPVEQLEAAPRKSAHVKNGYSVLFEMPGALDGTSHGVPIEGKKKSFKNVGGSRAFCLITARTQCDEELLAKIQSREARLPIRQLPASLRR